jgi:hypothetical protein
MSSPQGIRVKRLLFDYTRAKVRLSDGAFRKTSVGGFEPKLVKFMG